MYSILNGMCICWFWAYVGAHTGTTGFVSVIRVSRCGITRGTFYGKHVLTLIWVIMTGSSFKIVSNWAVLTICEVWFSEIIVVYAYIIISNGQSTSYLYMNLRICRVRCLTSPPDQWRFNLFFSRYRRMYVSRHLPMLWHLHKCLRVFYLRVPFWVLRKCFCPRWMPRYVQKCKQDWWSNIICATSLLILAWLLCFRTYAMTIIVYSLILFQT